jgi:hypothetical protein
LSDIDLPSQVGECGDFVEAVWVAECLAAFDGLTVDGVADGDFGELSGSGAGH